MAIQLTDSQQSIVDRAVAAVTAGDDFSVTGLAGTGKTVVLAHVARALRDAGFNPQVCAPTGKAAQNVTKKFPELAAKTLHSALSQSVNDRIAEFYKTMDTLAIKKAVWNSFVAENADWNTNPHHPAEFTTGDAEALEQIPHTIKRLREDTDDRLKFTAKEACALSFNVVIFDEASMIGKKIYRDLIEPIDVPKVYFGDHGQLPPIKDDPAIRLENADAKLTEIHRQKGDSGILKIAYAVNQGQRIRPDDYADLLDVTLIGSDSYSTVIPYARTHQILVWMNKDRHALNLILRERKTQIKPSQTPEDWIPQVGETLLCDQNSSSYALMNGDSLIVVPAPTSYEPVRRSNPYLRDVHLHRVGDAEEHVRCVTLNLGSLMPPEMRLEGRQDAYDRENAVRQGLSTIWGYAITCHKAQGSEYPKVCVFRPSTIPQDRDKWMYTACTRAQEELVIISPEFIKARSTTRGGLSPQGRLAELRKRA